jgi:hypothetical protein
MPSPGVYSQKRIGELRREGVEIEISDDIGWLYYLGDQSEVDSSGLLGTMAGGCGVCRPTGSVDGSASALSRRCAPEATNA